MDNETKEIVTEAKVIKDLLSHDGWPIARTKLTDKILDLVNIENVDDSSMEKMAIDLKARKLASVILFDWLKSLEAMARDVEYHKSLTLRDEGIIVREE